MTNYARGHDAEKVAAEYLHKQGYKILAINWRHPRAEIDIVAQKEGGPVLLVEVKYRTSMSQGSGFDYITARKLNQMQFAAELWVATNHYYGDYVLAAIELTGDDYCVTSFIEELL